MCIWWFNCFPDEVKTLKNNYGTSYSFDPYTVKDKSICVNGSFYGLDKLEMPDMFQSVIGPTFLNAKYVDFLYTLYQAGMLQIYSSDVTKYTFLITSNENFEISDMKLVPNGVEYMLESRVMMIVIKPFLRLPCGKS